MPRGLSASWEGSSLGFGHELCLEKFRPEGARNQDFNSQKSWSWHPRTNATPPTSLKSARGKAVGTVSSLTPVRTTGTYICPSMGCDREFRTRHRISTHSTTHEPAAPDGFLIGDQESCHKMYKMKDSLDTVLEPSIEHMFSSFPNAVECFRGYDALENR